MIKYLGTKKLGLAVLATGFYVEQHLLLPQARFSTSTTTNQKLKCKNSGLKRKDTNRKKQEQKLCIMTLLM
ncbi:hypothetical protein [Gottfriedia acidiceleris]|uniref:hypothetical protein n=1 Tax=Gottfriedia acidiceleris TaxID=371036 RepID=UPI002FFF6DC7